MNARVEEALRLWGKEHAAYDLIAERENAVYRVTDSDGDLALRLHRKGYRTDAELASELDWMAAVSRGGLSVPAPIPSLSGAVLHHVDGVQIDALTWLSGITLAPDALDQTARPRVFHTLGRDMARFHEISDAWDPPPDFERAAWDRAGLLGEAPLWDRFWDNPHLSPDDRTLFANFRHSADAALAKLETDLDYGLIHADLVPANVLVDGASLHFIDFDDGGFGFRLFDVATALLKHMGAADYPALRDSLLAGYRSVRDLDAGALDLFLALRAATYVGWNITRLDEPGGQDRNGRFAETLRALARKGVAA